MRWELFKIAVSNCNPPSQDSRIIWFLYLRHKSSLRQVMGNQHQHRHPKKRIIWWRIKSPTLLTTLSQGSIYITQLSFATMLLLMPCATTSVCAKFTPHNPSILPICPIPFRSYTSGEIIPSSHLLPCLPMLACLPDCLPAIPPARPPALPWLPAYPRINTSSGACGLEGMGGQLWKFWNSSFPKEDKELPAQTHFHLTGDLLIQRM